MSETADKDQLGSSSPETRGGSEVSKDVTEVDIKLARSDLPSKSPEVKRIKEDPNTDEEKHTEKPTAGMQVDKDKDIKDAESGKDVSDPTSPLEDTKLAAEDKTEGTSSPGKEKHDIEVENQGKSPSKGEKSSPAASPKKEKRDSSTEEEKSDVGTTPKTHETHEKEQRRNTRSGTTYNVRGQYTFLYTYSHVLVQSYYDEVFVLANCQFLNIC